MISTPMKNLITHNLHDKFSFIPSYISNMDINHVGPLTVINSYLATDMFNIVYINESIMPNPDEIAEAVDIFKTDRLPFAFWLISEDEKQLSKALIQCNLNCAEVELGMSVVLSNALSSDKINEELQIKIVDSYAILLDWIEVFCALLPDESSAITRFYQLADPVIQKFSSTIKCYVGYLNNQPVTTCALFFSESIAGIFDMITVPAAQRKRVATTMMLHVLNEAKLAGCKQVSLGASEEGLHVYKKLGFETHCEFKIYNPSYAL